MCLAKAHRGFAAIEETVVVCTQVLKRKNFEFDIVQIGSSLKGNLVTIRTTLGHCRQVYGPWQVCEILQWCPIGGSGVIDKVISSRIVWLDQ